MGFCHLVWFIYGGFIRMKKLVVSKEVMGYVIPVENRKPFLVYVNPSAGQIALAETDAMGGIPFGGNAKAAAIAAVEILQGAMSLQEFDDFSAHFPFDFRSDGVYVCESGKLFTPRGKGKFYEDASGLGKQFYVELMRITGLRRRLSGMSLGIE